MDLMEVLGQKSAVLKKLKERNSEFEEQSESLQMEASGRVEALLEVKTLREDNDKQADLIYQNCQQMSELETKTVELNTDNRSGQHCNSIPLCCIIFKIIDLLGRQINLWNC